MEKIEIVKHFKNLILCDKLILAGSLALYYYGFPTTPKDIDLIVVNPKEESVEMLKRLQKEAPCLPVSSYENSDLIRTRHSGIDIDFFIVRTPLNPSCEWVSINGIDLNPVREIVAAKKLANRPKDWFQLRKLGQSIVSDMEMEKFMDNFKL